MYHYVERGACAVSASPPPCTDLLELTFSLCAQTSRCAARLRRVSGARADSPLFLQNCLDKLKNAQKVRKGGWRDQAGEAGCKRCVHVPLSPFRAFQS